jgi:hypothetical protein
MWALNADLEFYRNKLTNSKGKKAKFNSNHSGNFGNATRTREIVSLLKAEIKRRRETLRSGSI